jgi:hypothetical protein
MALQVLVKEISPRAPVAEQLWGDSLDSDLFSSVLACFQGRGGSSLP